MKIGLYFGSFNPIHVGHLIIANHVINETDIQQLWFVVSPHNPLKPSSGLLDEYNRLHLVKSAINGENKLRTSIIEFHLAKPSYTVDTLAHLTEKYPQHQFAIIMGSDSFSNLTRWKNYNLIIQNHKLYLYERPGFKIDNNINAKIEVLNAPLLQISSTKIREIIKEGKSIRYLVTDNVKDEIDKNGYYK